MKIKFDATQQYQIDAVNAVVDLFDGQPLNQGDYEIILANSGIGLFASQVQTELGTGNYLSIGEDALLKNLQAVQSRNDIEQLLHYKAGTLPLKWKLVPDVIAYLQGETELTRSTIVRILKESARLTEFLVNPQKYMDAVAAILRRELHKLMIDGIKYEKLSDQEFSMRLFEEKEIISYLNSRLEVQHSVYDAIVYDSEIERRFAEDLDKRHDIKLFVKLPNWFIIETPIGTYNPDWALLKHDNSILYMVRETKGTKNFEKLRNSEAEKVRCGRRHFEALGDGVTFDVVTSSSEV